MQATSTIRCPSCGSRPVVSVSKTISRIGPPPPLAIGAPALPSDHRFLGAQRYDDCTQTAQAHAPIQAGRNNKIGTPAFLVIRHLIAQNRRQSPLRHTGSPHYPLLLHQSGGGYNDHVITPPFAAALEEQRDIEDNDRLAPR